MNLRNHTLRYGLSFILILASTLLSANAFSQDEGLDPNYQGEPSMEMDNAVDTYAPEEYAEEPVQEEVGAYELDQSDNGTQEEYQENQEYHDTEEMIPVDDSDTQNEGWSDETTQSEIIIIRN